ncbi:MAG: hypothetical protein LBS69_00180 [Prevotellaceae bacterium]|jgi:hypothetical protein|nr:hypothetical protein [Prevotellaceae bacterium]
MNDEQVKDLRADLQSALMQIAKIEDEVIRRALTDFIEKWLILTNN